MTHLFQNHMQCCKFRKINNKKQNINWLILTTKILFTADLVKNFFGKYIK